MPDGAVFRSCSTVKEEALSWIEDYAFYDIDGDNKKETLMLSAGPTSGVATFTFTAAKENGEKYENVFYSGLWSDMGFSEDENGKVQFYTVNSYTGEKRYYDLGVKDGNIEIEGY